MEFINKITLCGRVGSIKVQEVGNKTMARLSLATTRAFKDSEGTPVIETTWHTISVWNGENIVDVNDIHKGDALYIEGRLRTIKYCGEDGVERYSYEVIPNLLRKEEL